MKQMLFGLALGLVVGAAGLSLFNNSHTQTNSDFDINVLAGEYSAKGDYETTTVTITEVLKPSSQKSQREFKAQFYTGTVSGCVGEFMGFGKPDKDGISFERLDKHECKITAKPIDGLRYLEIKAEGKNCSDFSGAACGFGGKLEREGKFNHFVELEAVATEHPLEVLKLASASKALTEIMGADYNDLYDRMIASEDVKGTFEGNLYCAKGAKPGVASDNKAIFCLDYKNGQAQAAVMVDGKIKNYNKGKIWDPIAQFSPGWWRK